MSSVWSRIIVVACLCGSAFVVLGQDNTPNPKINSPYSRFGLGDFNPQYLAAQGGMGGLSAAYYDPYHINPLNPAALSRLDATAFEIGINARYSQLSAEGSSENLWSGNLTYLALAFPLINPINEVLDRKDTKLGLGMSFILQPYTTVGYNVEATQQTSGAGQSINYLRGTGETYRLSWSNGVRYGGLSGGLTLGYNWGTLENSRRVEFDSLALGYTTEFLDEFTLSGLFWRVGLQYTYNFKKLDDKGELKPSGKRLIFGLHGSTANEFNTESIRFGRRYNPNFGLPIAVDTLFSEAGVEGTGELPAAFTAGVTYERVNKLRLGVEMGIQQWSGYRNDAQSNTSLSDIWQVRFGGEYIPDYLSYDSYWERVRYRFGAFYGTDPRSFEGQQLLDYGLSLGFGFPIILPRQRTSFVNFTLEAGQFGLTDALQETYINMTLGFTLNDNTWFFKRKFN
ncbi:MAG: hypothetical protein RIC19_03955 [Phaeodactylibacter sp.]|uniref:hypothetical protein n=1 Tax=Phaeodactylibacter sp. TaxID=1940289 RepID=UPI0032EA9833